MQGFTSDTYISVQGLAPFYAETVEHGTNWWVFSCFGSGHLRQLSSLQLPKIQGLLTLHPTRNEQRRAPRHSSQTSKSHLAIFIKMFVRFTDFLRGRFLPSPDIAITHSCKWASIRLNKTSIVTRVHVQQLLPW